MHQIATENAGRVLEEAIKQSGNEKLAVKLNTAINSEDVHAIDIKYHKRCWRLNVFHANRTQEGSSENNVADEVAAYIEFLSLVESTLLDGYVVSMSVLHITYVDICSANNVASASCARKKVKK